MIFQGMMLTRVGVIRVVRDREGVVDSQRDAVMVGRAIHSFSWGCASGDGHQMVEDFPQARTGSVRNVALRQ